MLTILSWNILQGGGSRIPSIIAKIQAAKPSVCVFSEFRNNQSGDQIRKNLDLLGYKHQFITPAGTNDNSVIIASPLPCTAELHPDADPVFHPNILSVHFGFMSIMGCYLPHKKKHVLFDYIHRIIRASSSPYIITGDFNSGINGVDQIGTSFWYEDKMKAFPSLGYYDAFRHIYGDNKEYSWYSHQGNGFRYDHTYAHEDLLPIITECHYLHPWREARLSDHSPMWIKLGE
jgi:exodeoxyribonuclease III